MKLLNLNDIKPNPALQAILQSKGGTILVSGFVATSSKSSIAISKDLFGRSYCEYPRDAILAAFRQNSKSTRINLIVLQEADVKYVRLGKARPHSCGCKDDGEIGVAEARPWKSIHPELAKHMAEIQKILDSIGKGPGATYLDCAEKYHDCVRNGGNRDDCRNDEDMCIHMGTFG